MSTDRTFILPVTPTLIRQSVTSGSSFTGVRTVHADGVAGPDYIEGQDLTLYYSTLAGDGEGLFEFDSLITPAINLEMVAKYPHVYVRQVRIRVGTLVGWEMYMTNGDKAGGASDVDLVANDVQIEGTTGDAVITLDKIFPPRCCLRFKTLAATTAANPLVEVLCQAINGPAGGMELW